MVCSAKNIWPPLLGCELRSLFYQAFLLLKKSFKVFSCFRSFQTFLESGLRRDFLTVSSRIEGSDKAAPVLILGVLGVRPASWSQRVFGNYSSRAFSKSCCSFSSFHS